MTACWHRLPAWMDTNPEFGERQEDRAVEEGLPETDWDFEPTWDAGLFCAPLIAF